MTARLPKNPLPTLQNALENNLEHIRQRAQIILMTLDKKTLEDIAEETGLSTRTVQKWQRAWAEEGLRIFPKEMWVSEKAAKSKKASAPAIEETPTEQDKLATLVYPPIRLSIAFHDQPGVVASDTIREAGRKLLLFNLEQVVYYEPVAIAGTDIEGVHKMRVATRRMRSLFDVMGDYLDSSLYDRVQGNLRRTARRLGKVRDLDVFLHKTQHYIETALAGNAEPLAPLLDATRHRHERARKNLLKWLEDREFDRFVTHLFSLVQNPSENLLDEAQWAAQVSYVVPRLIYSQLEIIRAYENQLIEADADTFHMLRIEFKRLRYTFEFFEEVLGHSAKQVIHAIKHLQDHLGDMNDGEIALQLLTKLERKLPQEAVEATAAYRQARQIEIDNLRATFPQVWQQFNQPAIREAVAMAIAVL